MVPSSKVSGKFRKYFGVWPNNKALMWLLKYINLITFSFPYFEHESNLSPCFLPLWVYLLLCRCIQFSCQVFIGLNIKTANITTTNSSPPTKKSHTIYKKTRYLSLSGQQNSPMVKVTRRNKMSTIMLAMSVSYILIIQQLSNNYPMIIPQHFPIFFPLTIQQSSNY